MGLIAQVAWVSGVDAVKLGSEDQDGGFQGASAIGKQTTDYLCCRD